MSKIHLILQGKGGVGKTSTSANFAGLSAAAGWRTLFIEFTEEERLIYDLLQEKKEIGIDELTNSVALSPSTIAGNLLNLEFQGIVVSLPGKRYKLI